VLSNDTDAELDPLTAVLDSGPSHGTVTLSPNGGFTYTPTAGYTGPDSFTYRASDGVATSALATVTITVTPAAATTLHVADLDAIATTKANKWTASVTIEVRDDLGAAVSNAVVTGDFTSTGGTNRTCTTTSTGRCTIVSAQVAKSVASVTFTVRDVAKTGLTYAPSTNSDPDPGPAPGPTRSRRSNRTAATQRSIGPSHFGFDLDGPKITRMTIGARM